MNKPTRPQVTSVPEVRTDRPSRRARIPISPGVCSSNPSAIPNGALAMKWIQSACPGVNAGPLDVQECRTENVTTKATSSSRRNYTSSVVIELASLLYRVDDRREVVVGEDHAARVLATSVPLPIAMPMSASLIAGRR